MTAYLQIQGAYGRKYTTQAAIKVDLIANLDFHVLTIGFGSYGNLADFKSAGVQNLEVRYGKQGEKVAVFAVAKLAA